MTIKNSINVPFINSQAFHILKKEYPNDEYIHQRVVINYFTENIRNKPRGLLVYHPPGYGKTITAMKLAEKLGRKTIIFAPKSVHAQFQLELKRIRNVKSRNDVDNFLRYINENYMFVSSNASTKLKDLKKAAYLLNPKKFSDKNYLDDLLIIVDEAHSVFSSIVSYKSEIGTQIYRLFYGSRNTKFLFLTATPIINSPFESAIIFNLCRGPLVDFRGMKKDLFPTDDDMFEKYFIDRKTNLITNENVFLRRISGLVSHYPGSKESQMPIVKSDDIVRIPMSEFQFEKYVAARKEEIEKDRFYIHEEKVSMGDLKTKGKKMSTTFRSKSRRMSNFVFPETIDRTIPKNLKPGAREKKIKSIVAQLTPEMLSENKLERYSPKMLDIYLKIEEDKDQICLVYSQFKAAEGVGILSKILENKGWTNLEKSFQSVKLKGVANAKYIGDDFKRFIIWSGDVPGDIRVLISRIEKHPININGKLVRVFMITAAGAEGLNIKYGRKCMIMEPHWHETRHIQVKGRIRRLNSHVLLPENDRNVKYYTYIADPPKGKKIQDIINEDTQTTDDFIYSIAQYKQTKINNFLELFKKGSIDCDFHHNPNQKYKCFMCTPNKDHLEMFKMNISEDILSQDYNCVIPRDIPIKKAKKLSEPEKKKKKFNIPEDVYFYDGEFYIKLPGLNEDKFVLINV